MALLNLFKVGYSLATLVASPLLVPFFCLKPRGRMRLRERFGAWDLDLSECLWFHGASLGEINGIIPLIELAKRKWPGLAVLVTATSLTGLERAKEVANEVRLLPLDHPWWIKRALQRINPRVFVFGETEIWPALIQELSNRNVPMYMVNARISDKSYGSYNLFRPFLKFLFSKLESIAVADEVSKQRFLALGAETGKVYLAGNAKYDRAPSITSVAERVALKQTVFDNAYPVLVLGSLRPNEETYWFPAIAHILNSGAKLNIVVAPRHREKFEYFAQALTRFCLPFKRRSEVGAGGNLGSANTAEVLLLDTLGELERFYSMANMAFIGGTLENLGGHNPLEAAAYGACIVLGPHVQNIRELASQLESTNAVIMVQSEQDIERALQGLQAGEKYIVETGGRAQELCKKHQGAGARIVEMIRF